MALTILRLRVEEIFYEAQDILCVRFSDPYGKKLPKFNAGAHIDVYINDQLTRQYSLCNDPKGETFYEIAVLKESNGRGGSSTIHETFRRGLDVQISEPRNHFALKAGAKNYLLLAGGIGVTPMMAMVAELEMQKADYCMHYCTRSLDRTAFVKRLQPMISAGKVFLHHDNGNPTDGLDLTALVASCHSDTSLYFCGPPPFMKTITAAAQHLPKNLVHYEYFLNTDSHHSFDRQNKSFQVKIHSTGQTFEIPPNKTIIQVLRENGFPVDSSCEDGYCGTCITRYVEGEPEHRDTVLDDDDKEEFTLICCARSKSPLLVLDI